MIRMALVSLLLAVSLLSPGLLRAGVIVVDCEGPGVTSIQAGVDAAASGDTVLVMPCVYEERVSVVGKSIVLQGSGSSITELSWGGSGAVLNISGPASAGLLVRDLRISRLGSVGYALRWDDCTINLRDCVIDGTAWGAGCSVQSCVISRLLTGGGGSSIVLDSRIGYLMTGGELFGAWHIFMSRRNRYGEFELPGMVRATSDGDSIGALLVDGGIDAYAELEASHSRIDYLEGQSTPKIYLEDCTLGDLEYPHGGGYDYPDLSLVSCLVSGSLIIESQWRDAAGGVRSTRHERQYECFRLLHNTILGDLRSSADLYYTWPMSTHWVRGNIVVGHTELNCDHFLVVTHNDFVGGLSVTAPSDSVFANICADPLFCAPSVGDYSLQDCSPCVGASYDGGDVGALVAGCDCLVATETSSWGRIKGMFRARPPN